MVKCVDCGEDISERKEEKELKVEFSNPGTILLKANVMECPRCKSRYCDEDDAEVIFSKIEEEYSKLNHKKATKF